MSVTKDKPPICPQCEDTMILRNGAKGSFWGCVRFPACRGTRNVGDETKDIPKIVSKYSAIPKMPGSVEQEDIFDFAVTGRKHMVVNAAPGTGKTHTMIQSCLRIPKFKKILFLAFNKHIAGEAQGKLAASGCHNVEVRTFHSLGFKILRENFRKLKEPNEHKMVDILEHLSPPPLYGKAEWRKRINLANRLCSLVKNYGLDLSNPGLKAELERLIDHHAIDVNGSFEPAFSLVLPALKDCIDQAEVSVDFNDMPWLPVVLGLEMKFKPDIVIADEAQDLNTIQHDLTFKATKDRIFIVGDRHQAIYGFRGANTESIETFTERLRDSVEGVQEFPLTITRRCPKLHVQLAQALYPEIQALEDAPLGEILQMKPQKASAEMKPGDLVICRCNAPLIPTAYELIRRGVRPQVKGRDIGQGLISLIELLIRDFAVNPDAPGDLAAMVNALEGYRQAQAAKYMALGEKGEGRLAAMQDKCDCLHEFLMNSKSVSEMRTRIEDLFSDEEGKPNNAVVLGTVHRTKGLEAERVFVLHPELIPHPMAKKDWERVQERNVAWIAATRAKFDNNNGAPGTLIFCGEIPRIYQTSGVTANVEKPAPAPAPVSAPKPAPKPASQQELPLVSKPRPKKSQPVNNDEEVPW